VYHRSLSGAIGFGANSVEWLLTVHNFSITITWRNHWYENSSGGWMKEYTTDQIRNIVLLGHGSAGKTSLAEAMLFQTGATNRLGKVEEGTTVADFDEEEIRRHISLSLSLLPCEWKNHKINVLDTPGYTDFAGEVVSAVHVADAGLVLVDAVAGVEVGTELVWARADARELPRMVLINKMDRDNASFERTLDALRDTFGGEFVPVQLPIGSQADFDGVVDLITMKAFYGPDARLADIPDSMADQIKVYRKALMETVAAEGDEELILRYFESEELTDDEIHRGLKAAIASGGAIPVFCAAATKSLGIGPLMDCILALAPAPSEVGMVVAEGAGGEEEIAPDASGPLAALVFKTMADPYVGKLSYFRVYGGTLTSDTRFFNSRAGEEERLGQLYSMRGKEQLPVPRMAAGDIGAVAKLSHSLTGDTICDRGYPLTLPSPIFPNPLFSLAVNPKTQGDQAKMGPTLTRLAEEDPTLHWHQETSTRQTILSGMGEAHLDIAVRRMENRFGVGVETNIPKVPYRETITKTFSTQYRHKKQTGGAGQFAEVHARIEPLSRGEGFDYVWKVFGGRISSSFRPSIEKGIKVVLQQGVIAGYPVVDVRLAVTDGKEHPVDSKDIAFQIAGREVFKLAVQGAGPVLLEPIYGVEITVPDEYTGDVIGDLNTKRARVMGMGQASGKSIIQAEVPLAEMQRYATDLRSITQGRGVFSMELLRYDEVPGHLAQEIIEQAKREKEES
jgi:elongation factor G